MAAPVHDKTLMGMLSGRGAGVARDWRSARTPYERQARRRYGAAVYQRRKFSYRDATLMCRLA